jgi:hypothetical protein
MGITYEVDAAGIVFERWAGIVTATEMEAHWTRMVKDPRVIACRGSLADIRECEIRFSGEDLRRMEETILEPVFRGRQLKVAILVKDPIQYGVARQHRAFAGTFTDSAIFTDPSAAREWVLRVA